MVEVWRGPAEVPADLGRTVTAIGVFDGVHRGHAELIATAVARARAAGQLAVAVTFDPHPTAVLRPQARPGELTTVAHRAELLGELGIDAVYVLPFTAATARLTPAQFADQLLVGVLHAATVVVGANFTFGHRAAGDVAGLERLGESRDFTVIGVPLVGGPEVISATMVRALIGVGDVETARARLGRPFRVDGLVVRGDQRGRLLGYPTANLAVAPHTAIPADGVYAGAVYRLDATGRTLDRLGLAAISVGTNPTFDGAQRRVEAYILDFSGDLYGQRLGVEFAHRLRGMVRFDRVDQLVVQMGIDVDRARELLS